MNRKRKMNESVALKNNVYTGPFSGFAIEAEEPQEGVSFLDRRLADLWIKTMADQPTRPFWNPTMIGTWCAVIALILTLVSIIAVGAFYVGIQYQKTNDLERRLAVSEEASQKAALLEASKSGQTGHEEPKK